MSASVKRLSQGSPSAGSGPSSRFSFIEQLEQRTLMSSVSHTHTRRAAPGDDYLYAPHATVEGQSTAQWEGQWWQSVFAAPLYAADGVTPANPQNMEGAAARAGAATKGNVAFLYGEFDNNHHTRGSKRRPITIPAGASVFVPLSGSEWSNPDTQSKESNYQAVPGNYTASELAHFADVQTHATTHLNLRIDNHDVSESVLFAHRETAPVFSYNLPAKFNIDQIFYNEAISGPVSPAVADGYCVMLKPLSPGLHTITLGGTSSDLSATPPQLGPATGQTTYVINVLAPHRRSRG